MEPNRFKPYTRFGNGPKQYVKPHLTAVIGSAVEDDVAEAIKPYVDEIVVGNSGPAPAALVLEILDNLDAGQYLCKSEVDVDYIRDLATRSRRIVLVSKLGGKIEAFAVLFDGRDHVEITIVCSSENSKVKRAAAGLIKVAAQFAEALGKEEVFLESIQARKSYYEQFGFRQSGSNDGLIPMTAYADELLEGALGGGGRKTRRRRRMTRRRRTYRR
jgi:predicted GNAT family N-acyltransferase